MYGRENMLAQHTSSRNACVLFIRTSQPAPSIVIHEVAFLSVMASEEIRDPHLNLQHIIIRIDLFSAIQRRYQLIDYGENRPVLCFHQMNSSY